MFKEAEAGLKSDLKGAREELEGVLAREAALRAELEEELIKSKENQALVQVCLRLWVWDLDVCGRGVREIVSGEAFVHKLDTELQIAMLADGFLKNEHGDI